MAVGGEHATEMLGVDLGKNVCSVVGLEVAGAVVMRRKVRHETLIALAEKLPPCVVGMEACCGAHLEWPAPPSGVVGSPENQEEEGTISLCAKHPGRLADDSKLAHDRGASATGNILDSAATFR